MKIGVVSDTHRNTELLTQVVEWLAHRQSISLLCHLGDEYEDVAALEDTFQEVLQVPGIYHPGYHDGTIPAKVVETVQGIRLLLLHALEKDLTENDKYSADIILHGHTHRHELRLEDGRLVMNPGHLKAPMDKHFEATFGLIDIQERSIRATVFNLKHEAVEQMELVREESGLYKYS
jgi:putative phosphoesterase